MVEEPRPRERNEVVVEIVKEKPYVLYGFFAGLAVAWFMNGAQGENTGYYMIAAVAVYYYISRKTKKSLPTIVDVINEIVSEQARNNFYLDPNPKYVIVRECARDQYLLQFTKQHKTYKWAGKLAKGTREMFDIGAEIDLTNRQYSRVELGGVDIEEIRDR